MSSALLAGLSAHEATLLLTVTLFATGCPSIECSTVERAPALPVVEERFVVKSVDSSFVNRIVRDALSDSSQRGPEERVAEQLANRGLEWLVDGRGGEARAFHGDDASLPWQMGELVGACGAAADPEREDPALWRVAEVVDWKDGLYRVHWIGTMPESDGWVGPDHLTKLSSPRSMAIVSYSVDLAVETDTAWYTNTYPWFDDDSDQEESIHGFSMTVSGRVEIPGAPERGGTFTYQATYQRGKMFGVIEESAGREKMVDAITQLGEALAGDLMRGGAGTVPVAKPTPAAPQPTAPPPPAPVAPTPATPAEPPGPPRGIAPGDTVWGLFASPDGTKFAAVVNKDVLVLERGRNSEALWRRPSSGSSRGQAIAWTPDGSAIACVDKNSRAILRDAATGDEIAALGVTFSYRATFAVSKETNALAIGDTTELTVIDLTTREVRFRSKRSDGGFDALAFTPDGTLVVAGVFSVRRIGADGKDDRALDENHEAFHVALAVSADGQHVAAGLASGRIRYWAPGAERAIVIGGPSPVRALAFTADGKRLVVAGEKARFQVIYLDDPASAYSHYDGQGDVTAFAFVGEEATVADSVDGLTTFWLPRR